MELRESTAKPTIRINDDVYATLKAAAAKAKMPVTQYASLVLMRGLSQMSGSTGVDAVDDAADGIASDVDVDFKRAQTELMRAQARNLDANTMLIMGQGFTAQLQTPATLIAAEDAPVRLERGAHVANVIESNGGLEIRL